MEEETILEENNDTLEIINSNTQAKIMLNDKDTIAAVATAKGNGALSIVRMSGDKTSEILRQGFFSKNFSTEESHKFFYGIWKNKLGHPTDEVVLLYYKKGTGFTGEEAAEIICHGGSLVTSLILNSILDFGARLARPGEFTYRAVINEKMDLPQAESVLELINASSKKRAQQALKNIKGGFSDSIKQTEEELLTILAYLEADIDFSAEDISPINYKETIKRTGAIVESLKKSIFYFELNRKYQNGISVAISGLPNAGKSSLINELSGKERSIVSSKPGTTRDVVETEIQLEGIKIRLLDTAGIRKTDEEIEKKGVEKAKEEINKADVVLYVIDSQQGVSHQDKENLLDLENSKVIICFNKVDLLKEKVLSTDIINLSQYRVAKVSCINKTGLEDLLQEISNKAEIMNESETELIISSERQKELFSEAQLFLEEGIRLLKEKASPDLVSFEFKNALLKLKDVLGEEFKDDILDKVFKEFCIGK